MAPSSNNHYPRGIPFRPPPQPAVRKPVAPRRPLFFLVLGGAALVAISAAVTVFVLDRPAPTPPPAPPTVEQPRASNQSPESQTKPPPASEIKPPPTPGDQPAAEKAPRPTTERLLEALGGLSAAQVYQSYLNIGLLADGVQSEAYTKAEAEQMLATVTSLIDLLDRQLERVAELRLDADNLRSIERVQRLTVLLRRQGSALRSFWAGGGAEQIARYHEAREATWSDLSELLGIK